MNALTIGHYCAQHWEPHEDSHAPIGETTTQNQPNQRLELSIPGAAQSVCLPLCLLPGLAAQAHVGQVRNDLAVIV